MYEYWECKKYIKMGNLFLFLINVADVDARGMWKKHVCARKKKRNMKEVELFTALVFFQSAAAGAAHNHKYLFIHLNNIVNGIISIEWKGTSEKSFIVYLYDDSKLKSGRSKGEVS